ncbi:Bardet-Biedl syndrome 1 protein homolog isoform X2 [Leptidea sinapis]|uniref:Bardet-Biedl syndrome 1 protein homolog isoform X2 n=1 Tax=Leptidea sinapis TaxID=189913 RepID=UPI00214389EB|nr:Bardet-Biedl syndrome 1 protein homolog isoform X2 [Leptidea sinapis]
MCITWILIHLLKWQWDKAVILLKHGSTEGRHLFSTEEHIVAIEVMMFDNSIMVICCDKTLSSYTKKGKKQWWLSLEHRPVAMCLVPVLHLGVTLTAVALSSGHVYLYDGKIKRDTVFVRDVASVIKFGRLGQEEHAFIIITASGNLMLKLLKRTAEFNGQAAGVDLGNPSVGQKPWMIPKKSKLFLEQSMRERENATAMYETFQHDLNKLRLKVASTLIEAHTRSDNTLAVGDLESIKLAAEVDGLGPMFLMTLIVENRSQTKSVVGLSVLFHLTTSYKVDTPYIKVPLLSPGCKLRFRTKIEEIFSENMNPDILFRSVTGQGGEGSMIKILLLKAGKCRPVLAANVQMPPTDPLLVPCDKMQPSGFKGDDVADF